MASQFSGPSAGRCRFVLTSVLLTAIVALVEQPAYSQLPGDYNYDGIVSHADYSVLGDSIGQVVLPGTGADGNFDGFISLADYEVYRAHYGHVASSPILPLIVSVVPVSGGNLQWTFTIPNVNGALAGHLNISTGGPSVLSVQGGPSFLDNGIGPVGVPGFNAFNAIQEGISFSGNKAFAALGTTLVTSPSLHDSHSTLEFLRLVTAGQQPMTLSYAGKFGYQGIDLVNNGSASYVPEPASWTMVCSALLLSLAARVVRRCVSMGVMLAIIVALVEQPAHGTVGLTGDYNNNGIVSHGDYSVLGDHFGSFFQLPNEGPGVTPGAVTIEDFNVYRTHYGQTASLPAILPLTVSAVPAPGGHIEWTFTFSNVDGALAGHLNISTNGPGILSAQGGPMFQDDGSNPVGVPGLNQFHVTQEGISFASTKAFAALGTTLALSPALHNSDSTLEFLRLVTAGLQPTTLTYSGEFGYQGQDYVHSGIASTMIPEPATLALGIAALMLSLTARATRRRRN